MANKKHPHAEMIVAWANGEEIECMTARGWRPIGRSPSWTDGNKYRIKPAEPEREPYPETSMNGKELDKIFFDATNPGQPFEAPLFGFLAVANAALRHACDNGQIVTRAEFDRAIGDRASRDMAVARAVYKACAHEGYVPVVDLYAVVDKVK